MIDLALHHARCGYRVFPLAPDGKVPAIKGGHGCRDATTDTKQIERWWQEYPGANVGIATGSGLLVIDIDPRKDASWLQSLTTLELPQTFTVRTWSGGWHLYLRCFPDDRGITIGADLLPGIDWRCNGGYVVSAGSIVQGATYTVAKNLPIAVAPAHLLTRLVRPSAPPIERKDNGEMVIPATRRNDTLTRIAGSLRRHGVDFNALWECLRAINTDHCSPPLEDRELRTIAASIARYPAGDDRGAA